MSHSRIKPKLSKEARRYGWRETWPLWVLGGSLTLLIVACFVQLERVYGPQKSDVSVIALKPAQDLHLDTSTLNPMQSHLFEANVSGKKVRFIVERTQDKVIHVALASCRVCYRSRDRHYARKGEMICGECNGTMPFETKSQKTPANTCALGEIPHKEVGRDLFVSVSDVMKQTEGLQ
ncbi:MAG TPA: Fe-S-containing protein [Candidatus Binatia bacterium]|nr:Fe-S-containing protein [Candidatus Binatia bacterium]